MGVLGIAGMWVILTLGATLTAPPDLAGKWALLPPGTRVPSGKATAAMGDPPAGGGAGKTPMMAVEQSGEFFQVTFDETSIDGGLLLKLRLKPMGSGADASGKPQQQAMQLSGGLWNLTMAGMLGTDVLDVTLAGPRQGHWTARRTVHTFAANPGSIGSGTAGGGEHSTAGTRE
jgi:hypothetical protein